jgi:hypothetical protein
MSACRDWLQDSFVSEWTFLIGHPTAAVPTIYRAAYAFEQAGDWKTM